MNNNENNLYNKGNNCDCCENQYLCGKDGDMYGCKCMDENKACNFIEYDETEQQERNRDQE